MTNTLQNSLINTLERGYNIDSITSALSSIASGADAVTDAANKAAQALANMGAAKTDYSSGSGSSENGRKYAVVSNGKRVSGYFSSAEEANEWIDKNNAPRSRYYVAKYAKGGIITKDKKNPLNHIAEAVGEDTLIAGKEGEGVLTKDQTEAITDLASSLDKSDNTDNEMSDDNRKPIRDENGMISLIDVMRDIDSVRDENGNIPEHISQLIKLKEAITEINGDILTPPLIQPGMPYVRTPDFVRSDNINNINVRYDSLLTVNGDINDTKHFTGQITGCIVDTLERINRDFAIHCR